MRTNHLAMKQLKIVELEIRLVCMETGRVAINPLCRMQGPLQMTIHLATLHIQAHKDQHDAYRWWN